MLELLVTVHVLGALLWVGGSVVIHILARRTVGRGDPQEIFAFSKEMNTVGLRLFLPATLIMFVAGLLLVHRSGFAFSQTWIVLALVGFAVCFLIGVGFYGPQDKRLQALVAAEGPSAPGVTANVHRALTVNAIELAILLLIVIDMTTKPGL